MQNQQARHVLISSFVMFLILLVSLLLLKNTSEQTFSEYLESYISGSATPGTWEATKKTVLNIYIELTNLYPQKNINTLLWKQSYKKFVDLQTWYDTLKNDDQDFLSAGLPIPPNLTNSIDDLDEFHEMWQTQVHKISGLLDQVHKLETQTGLIDRYSAYDDTYSADSAEPLTELTERLETASAFILDHPLGHQR